MLLMSGAGARKRGFEEELKATLGNREDPGRFTQGMESVMKIKLRSRDINHQKSSQTACRHSVTQKGSDVR